jgi:hypothetical protein
MKQIWLYILELLGLLGILSIIAFISWTKMLLGAALTAIWAFFPQLKSRSSEKGEGRIESHNFKATLKGTLRFGVIFAGLVLVVGAVLDGHTGLQKFNADIKNTEIKANETEAALTAKIKGVRARLSSIQSMKALLSEPDCKLSAESRAVLDTSCNDEIQQLNNGLAKLVVLQQQELRESKPK